jgi:hypothetical protein
MLGGEMMLQANVKPRGRVTAVVWRDGKVVRTYQKDNMVVLPGKNNLLKFLNGEVVTGLERVSIGSDDGTILPLALSNAALGNETARFPFTDTTRTDNNLEVEIYQDETQGNGTHHEVGLMCNGATDVLGTGDLYARLLMDWEKAATESMTWLWEVYFD